MLYDNIDTISEEQVNNIKLFVHTRVLQNILSLGSNYFSASIPPLLKHIFVTFLPSQKKQINSLLLVSVETLINRAAKRTSRRTLISRKHFLKPWKYKEQGLRSGE